MGSYAAILMVFALYYSQKHLFRNLHIGRGVEGCTVPAQVHSAISLCIATQ